MKTIKHFFLILCLMASVQVWSQTLVDGIWYNFSETEAEVTYSDGTNKPTPEYIGISDIVIPSTVTYNEIDYPVTSIGRSAFRESSLTSIEIPSSVTTIGEYAFFLCYDLTSIEIPSSVTSLGKDAFHGCTGLTSITIPSSVTSIGKGTFTYCMGLVSVTIPSSVTSIGDAAFYECSRLPSIVIPNGVTSIGSLAFSSCYNLTSIVIPSSVTSIGYWIFAGSDNLTSVINLNPVPFPFTPGSISFSGFDFYGEGCLLYVPAGSKEAYQKVNNWKYFNIIELPDVSGIGVDILPSDTTAIIVWQLNENAEGYKLMIYADEKREELIYILEFDAGGQLVTITSLRSGNAEESETPIYAYIIENLLKGTTYYYTLEPIGVAAGTLSGMFTTTGGEPSGTVETRRATLLSAKII